MALVITSAAAVVMVGVYLALSIFTSVLQDGLWGPERPCMEGQVPLKSAQPDADGTYGATCVEAGRPVPRGYTTFAPGHTPTAATDTQRQAAY